MSREARQDIFTRIARIRTDFPEKFGIPRQSGLVPELTGRIVFEPDYRQPDAVKGLEGYDYLWLLWHFDGTRRAHWSATVKPPRLGGNTRMGVFATRSPFRPNPIGLSCVKLEKVEITEDQGPVIWVSGVDLKDGTWIYDIKPYLPYADAHEGARGGFSDGAGGHRLKVIFPPELLSLLPADRQEAAVKMLMQDPRPAYQDDPNRRYGVSFAGHDIRFFVRGDELNVVEVVELPRHR